MNTFKCRVCSCRLRLTDNWEVHRAKYQHYICVECETGRKSPKVPKGHGYVYLLSNDNHPGQYKIGKSRNPQMRVQMFNTSCPSRSFRLKAFWYDQDYSAFEREVHQVLAEYRIPGGEWFEGNGDNFKAIIGALHAKRLQQQPPQCRCG